MVMALAIRVNRLFEPSPVYAACSGSTPFIFLSEVIVKFGDRGSKTDMRFIFVGDQLLSNM